MKMELTMEEDHATMAAVVAVFEVDTVAGAIKPVTTAVDTSI